MIVASLVIYIFILHFTIILEDTETLIRLLYDWDPVNGNFIELCEYLFGQKHY